MTISRHDRPRFEPSRRRLVWDSGAVAQIFSSEDPDSLRGPQFEAAWCDELAKWKHADACFDMLQFGLRLGDMPRQIITTTPRPVPLLKRLLADPASHGDAHALGGKRCQPGAGFPQRHSRPLWRHAAWAAGTGRRTDRGSRRCAVVARDDRTGARRGGADLRRIVVAVDPPASSRKTSDACGIVAAGLDGSGQGGGAGRRDGAGRQAAGLGRRGGRGCFTGWRPIASSPRSTRAATW